MPDRQSLSKDLYDAGRVLRAIQIDHHNGCYEGQSVTIESIEKVRAYCHDLTSWLEGRALGV